MSLSAHLDALRDDARIWDGVAAATGEAAGAATGLGVGASAFSWAGPRTGLDATYEEVRAKVQRLLEQATDNFTEMGATLRDVADTYQAGDEQAVRRLDGAWEPRTE
ncbi:MAG: hypothetical protein ACFCVG_09165 [Kineosporiaceae bacterium]